MSRVPYGGGARRGCTQNFWTQCRIGLRNIACERPSFVHLVLKAMSEQGVRLNIKKATLRTWRSEFARHLRLLGVAANATERVVRGESRKAKKDGIYRASQRGDSTYIRTQAEAIAAELLRGDVRVDPGKRKLVSTRVSIRSGWRDVARLLARDGEGRLASDAARYAEGMPAPQTEREQLAASLHSRLRAPSRTWVQAGSSR